MQDFENCGLFFGKEILETEKGGVAIGGFLATTEEQPEEIEIAPIFRAWCVLGGLIAAEGLDSAKSFRWMACSCHCTGPAHVMVEDIEGGLLSVAWGVVGPKTRIVSLFDHHAKMTQSIIDSVDLLVATKRSRTTF